MTPGGVGSIAGTSASTGSAQPAHMSSNPLGDGDKVDPQIASLARDFKIEDRLMRKLNAIMQRRPLSFDDDIVTLRDKLGQPRAEIGVLITQLDKGIFVSRGSMHPDIIALVDKYGLDYRASER